MALTLGAGPVAAETAIPAKRVVLQADTDLPGGDLGPVFNTSQAACVQVCLADDACTALTYNANARACFPKAGTLSAAYFAGAQSGHVVQTDPALIARAQARLVAAGKWLTTGDRAQALRQAEDLGQAHLRGANAVIQSNQEITAGTDLAGNWLALSQELTHAANNGEGGDLRQQALAAATNAWLRDPGDGAAALIRWARASEPLGRGRDGLAALRSLPAGAPGVAEALTEFEGRHGFSVQDNRVESDAADPRLCINFSDEVAQNTDLRPFVGLPDPAMAVESQGAEICITGLTRGAETTVTMRAGLPAASGEVLPRDVPVTAYVRDRNPMVRFGGRAYVLPASGDQGLTMTTINAATVDLVLYRMSDRNLAQALREGVFGGQLQNWRLDQFGRTIGQQVWTGQADATPAPDGGNWPMNAEVATRLDLRAQTGALNPGVYALVASVPGANPDITPEATQWFMVSDLGLSSFSGTDGLTVAVRALSDAAARAGVQVALVSRGNAVLGTAVTDDQGIARFDAGLVRGRDGAAPALVTATQADGGRITDLSFLSLTDPEFDLSDRGVEGNPPAPPVDVFMALDRGAYRAGETAHATILTRDGQAAAIDGLPLTAAVVRPDGTEQARLMPAPAGEGGFTLDVPIPATAPRGAWRIDLRVEQDGPALASARMLVEDFLPERIAFDLSLPDTPLPPAGDLRAHIDARWLFGAPAADLPVEGELNLIPARSWPRWNGYRFGRHDDSQPQSAQMVAGQTDAQGGFDAVIAMPPALATTARPWTAQLRLTVLEGAGRPVERRATALVLPSQVALGIRPDFPDEMVAEGSDAGFTVVALGPDLTPVSGDYDWSLNRVETDYQWYAIDGNWQWEPITRRTPAGSGKVTLAGGPAALSVPVDWGQYELVLRGAEGAESSVLFYAGWGVASGVQDTPDRLRVTLDRPAYRPGDTARVSFEAPADGAALISIMSNRLVSLQTATVTAGMNTVDLPVTDDWGAGVYVAVSAIRPVGADAGHAPVRGLGLAPAAVDPGTRRLGATIEAPAEADPRQDVPVTLAVTGAEPGQTVHATIWAVDQGILNLTGYAPPSASDHYFGQRRLGVGLRDLYGRLIMASGAADGAIRTGGDAGSIQTQAPPPTEKLMAWFSGPLVLDGDGRVSVPVPLPDFNGEVRLMALAWTGTAVGQADATMLVRDPVVMTVTAPAFLAPGDSAQAQVVLTHVSGPSGTVGLSVERGEGSVGIEAAGLPDTVQIEPGARLPLTLALTAPDTQGPAELRLTASLPDGRSVTKDLAIPVIRADQPVTRAMRLTLAPGDSVTPDLSGLGGFAPGSGRITLASGAYALLDVPAAITLLTDYPYGCTEQIASSAMPRLYLAGLMPEGAPVVPGATPRDIGQAIAQILTRQTAQGGFGLWDADYSDPWLDAYVTDFLSRARAAGHAVPDAAFRRALVNLQNRLNAAADPQYASGDETAAMAYAALVLAREGAAVISDLRYYADTGAQGFATPLAAAQLGAALASLGDQARADRMFARARDLLTEGRDPSGFRGDYGTLLRDRAGVLALAAEAGTQVIDRPALARQIADGIAARSAEGASLSTQEAVWTVLAGHALTAPDTGDGVTLAGAPLPGPVADLGDAAAPLSLPLGNAGNTPVDVTLSATAVPLGDIRAGGTAYRINRSYYTPEGAPADPAQVAQGTRLVAVIEVTPFDTAGGRLIVNDPLPAGFEIDNPNLLSAADVSGMDWLGDATPTDMAEFRADRFAASLVVTGTDTVRLAYRLRAVTAGRFHHPAATVADFYRPERRGWTDSGTATITP
ncbi:MAG: alpha-2-macroglobulin family protein [Paracoccus sp. (in: a-proteobacteria)]|nr:alpha-2-macroglobulin family protein [Paracoccus sp. (in: a-proteobacteria)]